MSQTHKRFKRTLIYYDTDTQSANFWGNPLRQATKQHVAVKRLKTMNNQKRKEITSFLVDFSFFSPSWKNVGMTMTCNRCDVMNIM